MSRALWICGALALMAGCNRPNWSTPVDAYRSFLRALTKGDVNVAYGALSTPSRDLLAARAKELSTASGGSLRDDPAALFFVNAADAAAVTEITLRKQEGDRAVLAVTAPGGVKEVNMVREAEGWRIAIEPGTPLLPPSPVPSGDAGPGVDVGR